MKITAIGIGRKVYAHAILDCELKKSGQWDELTWYVDKHTGNITFFWAKGSLSMSGNYQFSAELSRKEIVTTAGAWRRASVGCRRE